jgi:hypothetical protein
MLRVALLVAALAVAGIPVWLVTRPVAAVAVTVEGADARVMHRVVATASRPAELRISAAGCDEVVGSGGGVEARWLMDPALPEDVVVGAEFAEGGTPGAVRVVVERGGLVVADETFWGEDGVEDVVTLARE